MSRRKYRSDVHYQGQGVRGTVRPCVAGADKCDECGATLKSPIDRMLHFCDRFATSRASYLGDRRTRTAL